MEKYVNNMQKTLKFPGKGCNLITNLLCAYKSALVGFISGLYL